MGAVRVGRCPASSDEHVDDHSELGWGVSVLSEDIWIPLSRGDRVRGHHVALPLPFGWLVRVECNYGSWPDGYAFIRFRGKRLRRWFEANPLWEVEDTTELFEKGYWATYIGPDATERRSG